MRLAVAALAMFGISSAVRGDVVILKKGDRLEGIVTPAPGRPDSILLRNYKGTRLEIQRDRISSIQEEPDSVDWRRIGDQFFNDHLYPEALDAYKQSASYDPADTKTVEQIRATQLALQREATLERRKQVESINRMLDEAAQKTDRKAFEAAESILLKDAPVEVPTDDQQKRILDLKKALYKGWALEMEDKLRSNDAAKYFEKLLIVDPLDKDAYDRLIVIWEKMPEKTPQVIEAHKVHLKLNPGDTKIRQKLAEKYLEYANAVAVGKPDTPDRARRVDALYESAVEQYETLIAGQESLRPDITEALSKCLQSLYSRAEKRKDYDRAIAYYRRLQRYSKAAGDDVVYTMEYHRDALKIGPKDADAMTTLALRARKQGLTDLAREEIRRIKKQFPDNGCVNRALAQYADEELLRAQEALRTLKYEQADAIAAKCATDYSFVPGVAERAEQLRNLAKVALEAHRRTASEEGRKWKELGDSAFREGLFRLETMRRTDVNRNIRVVSDKNEAIAKFQLAIQYYDKALSLWTNMDAATRQEIRVNYSDAQEYLANLTSTIPIPMPLR
jgi:hypothetical protein